MAGLLPEGHAYRLPTEAEWEYACRAGTGTSFHFGSEIHSGIVNFSGRWEYNSSEGTLENLMGIYLGRTMPVGSYEPNPWGLYDMHGNVWEWCQDWYRAYPLEPVIDPIGPSAGPGRILRGGGASYFGRGCRSAFRLWTFPDVGFNDLGFRVVLSHPVSSE